MLTNPGPAPARPIAAPLLPWEEPLKLTPTQALTQGFVVAEAVSHLPTQSQQHAEDLLRQGFRIGDLKLMVRYEDGSELTDLPALYRLPNSPHWFRGVSNLHGTLVPVFDLGDFFGIDHLDSAKPMLLVLGHGAQAAGIVIDGLPQRLRARFEHQLDRAAIPAVLNDCVEQGYRIGEDDWLDFRYAPLFERLVAELTQ
jgi:twitching motility protein PilI